jgi:hypothetical protein
MPAIRLATRIRAVWRLASRRVDVATAPIEQRAPHEGRFRFSGVCFAPMRFVGWVLLVVGLLVAAGGVYFLPGAAAVGVGVWLAGRAPDRSHGGEVAVMLVMLAAGAGVAVIFYRYAAQAIGAP